MDFLRRMMSKHCNVDSMLISDYFRIRAAMLNDAGTYIVQICYLKGEIYFYYPHREPIERVMFSHIHLSV